MTVSPLSARFGQASAISTPKAPAGAAAVLAAVLAAVSPSSQAAQQPCGDSFTSATLKAQLEPPSAKSSPLGQRLTGWLSGTNCQTPVNAPARSIQVDRSRQDETGLQGQTTTYRGNPGTIVVRGDKPVDFTPLRATHVTINGKPFGPERLHTDADGTIHVLATPQAPQESVKASGPSTTPTGLKISDEATLPAPTGLRVIEVK